MMNHSATCLIIHISVLLLLFFPSLTRASISRTDYDRQRISSKNLNGQFIYNSSWNGSGRWAGPQWWANPLFDWKIQNGWAVGLAAIDRTLCFLPAEIKSSGTWFSLRTHIRLVYFNWRTSFSSRLVGGFRIGRKGKIDDFRNSVVYPKKWIDAAIRGDGRLILGRKISSEHLDPSSQVVLHLSARRLGKYTHLILRAEQGQRSSTLSAILPTDLITGGFSILSNGPIQTSEQRKTHSFAFRNFEASGNMIQKRPNPLFGPILWCQYTLSNRSLRLQAQLAPVDFPAAATLWILEKSGKWRKTSTVRVEPLSMTALFTVGGWNDKVDTRYEVRTNWKWQTYSWSGVVRREPKNNSRLKMACFSCDNGYLFPLTSMVRQVRIQNPDMLFFAGDQIYESFGGFGTKRKGTLQITILDFLRKHYLFGWTWRELLRDRPSVILPDDHDVFQGNLFGHGGRELPFKTPPKWDSGGYLMPGAWVATAERINAGHLPKPAFDMTLPIGIKPYFTSFSYGGVGFAVLEDRKFKTGPSSLPPRGRISGEGAELLGKEQEKFLQNWAKNWKNDIMKCALSQTIFASAATHRGENLKKINYFHDSGGWPQPARNRVVRILGDNNVLSVHGDQHLGMLLKQGVETFDDAGYAFMVPGTANGFPRAWWPNLGNQQLPRRNQKFTGRFFDGAGHPLHVLAVGNPAPGSNLLRADRTKLLEIGYRKGSGYGIVEFDKNKKVATFKLYRSGDKPGMFEGFPQTVYIGGNPIYRS